MKAVPIILAVGFASVALAQADLIGEGQYPQFRSQSGLPGGGFPVAHRTGADFSGALAWSTPVAYSLAPWQYLVGGSSLARDDSFVFFEEDLSANNSTLVAMVGVPLGDFGRTTFTHMVLSELGDHAQNLHWVPGDQRGPLVFAVGVQDISGQGGSQGDTGQPNRLDPGESRTYYLVLSTSFGETGHLSAGLGDTRFQGRPFFNASHNVGERVKAFAEWDTFNWNYGAAYSLGKVGALPERNGQRPVAAVSAGLVRGKYAFWALNLSF